VLGFHVVTVARALVAGILVSACKSNDKPANPPAGGSDEGLSKVAVTAPPQLADAAVAPTLPGEKGPTAEAAFAAQARDEEWAPTTETEIEKRFAKIRGAKLEDAECRQSQCKLVVHGSQADVSQTIADLESHRGLHGYATNVLLTAPEKRADGTLVLRVFAIFDR